MIFLQIAWLVFMFTITRIIWRWRFVQPDEDASLGEEIGFLAMMLLFVCIQVAVTSILIYCVLDFIINFPLQEFV